MADYREAFVGIDVAKMNNAIAVAECGQDGEVRYVGEVEETGQDVETLRSFDILRKKEEAAGVALAAQ
nr:hypothetical protein [Rhizobium leguminosarum]